MKRLLYLSQLRPDSAIYIGGSIAVIFTLLVGLIAGAKEFAAHGDFAAALYDTAVSTFIYGQLAGFIAVVLFIGYCVMKVTFSHKTIMDIVHFLRFVIILEAALFLALAFIRGNDIESAFFITALYLALWMILIYILLYGGWGIQFALGRSKRKNERG